MSFDLDDLQTVLSSTSTAQLAGTIVNAPFKYRYDMVAFGIGIIVFLIADAENDVIHRVSLSRTELAEGTIRMSEKKFEDIKIPLSHQENIIAKAIRSDEPQSTTDWRYLFSPALTPDQARLNQAGGGIACSFVYPLIIGENKGALIFSYYKYHDKVGAAEREFMEKYSGIVSNSLTKHKDMIGDIIQAKTYPRTNS